MSSFGSTHLPAPTPAEIARREACRKMGCVACAMLGVSTGLRVEFHHLKEGVQLGHRFGVALCQYHHRQVLPKGYTQALARAEFGPSVMSSAAFARRFGDNQALLNVQDDVIGYPHVTIERVRHNPERSRCLPGRKVFKGFV